MNSDSQTRWSGRISSHWDTCWKDSNEHWEGAVAMVERLQKALQDAEQHETTRCMGLLWKLQEAVPETGLASGLDLGIAIVIDVVERLQVQVEHLEKAEAVQPGPRITVYGPMQPEGSEEAPQGYA